MRRQATPRRRAMAMHRQQILPIAWLLVLAAACLAGLMLFAAIRLDARTREESIEAMHAGLNERADQLDRVVKDYAWWNEAVEAIQLAHDRDWAAARLGPYLYGTHEYDWAFVIAPDDSTFFAALKGEPSPHEHGRRRSATSAGGRWWQARAASRPRERQARAWRCTPSCRCATASSASPRPPRSCRKPPGTSAAAERARPIVLIVVRELTGELADGAGDRVGASMRTGCSSAPRPAEPCDGAAVQRPGRQDRWARLAWRPNRPGTQFLQILAPSLAWRSLLFVAFGWSALRQSRSTTSAIVESETRFRDVADASSDWIFETDAEGRLTWISERFIALTGIPLGEIEGRPDRRPAAADDRRGPVGRARRARMREQRLFRSIPRCYLDLEGRPRALRVSGKPTRDDAGRHIGWRGTATDVTVEIEARKTAEFLSGHDALTGALNRQGLIEGTTRVARGRAAARPAGGLPVARPRPVQGGQRRPWPDRRRPADPGRGRSGWRSWRGRATSIGAPGCRRVRAGPPGGRRRAGGAAPGPSAAGRAGAAAGRRRPGDRGHASASPRSCCRARPTTAERALHVAGMVMTRAKEDGRSALRFFEPGMDARLQARKALERDLAGRSRTTSSRCSTSPR